MMETTSLLQNDNLMQKNQTVKRNFGQYFTNHAVASYMAKMINPIDTHAVRILDAGAGTGVLTIFSVMHCLKLGNKRIHAVLYEIDESILPTLLVNMKNLVHISEKQGGKFTFTIYNKDFVLSRPDKTGEPFHISIINPPYFKYNAKNSPYAKATADLYKGNPNIYASFMAIVTNCLVPNGQMIAIVPRSFTSGLYFKDFRRYINQTVSLDKIHIFTARNKIFKEASVLQENIICCYTKNNQKSYIDVYTSAGYEDLKQTENNKYPAKTIIDKSTKYEIIRIPETLKDARMLKIVEQWPINFQENGYFVSTGPVVEFRTRKYLACSDMMDDTIPLLKMHNIEAFRTKWTRNNKKDLCFKLIDGYEKHTTDNLVYVILRRFSSKDEKRRLIAAVHNPQIIKGQLIAIENHLNYIGRKDRLLDLAEAYGLAALFNSTIMDKYFRCLSGNTQVNATEIKLLKMPNQKTICQIGKSLIKNVKVTQNQIDDIINFHLK